MGIEGIVHAPPAGQAPSGSTEVQAGGSIKIAVDIKDWSQAILAKLAHPESWGYLGIYVRSQVASTLVAAQAQKIEAGKAHYEWTLVIPSNSAVGAADVWVYFASDPNGSSTPDGIDPGSTAPGDVTQIRRHRTIQVTAAPNHWIA